MVSREARLTLSIGTLEKNLDEQSRQFQEILELYEQRIAQQEKEISELRATLIQREKSERFPWVEQVNNFFTFVFLSCTGTRKSRLSGR